MSKNNKIKEKEMVESPQEETIRSRLLVLLNKGYSRSQLITDFGFAERTVDTAIKEFKELTGSDAEQAGQASPPSAKDGMLAIRKDKESVLPEWLEPEIADIFDGNIRDRKLFMAGMSIPILGLRMFGEAVKPITDLYSVWQQAQVEVAKSVQGSSAETAHAAAHEALAQAMPQILGAVRDSAKPESPNPMAGMMTRLLESPLQNLMGMFMKGFASMPGMGAMTPGMGMMPGQMPMSPGQIPQPGQPPQPAQPPQPGPAGPMAGFGPQTRQVSRQELEDAFDDE